MGKLQGKRILITGASSGIGRETALALAGSGAVLLLTARRQDALTEVQRRIIAAGDRAFIFPADLSRREEVERLGQRILSDFEGVDILINNAGFGLFDPVSEGRVEDWEQMMAVNFFAAAHLIRLFLPPMLKKGEGHLINVASIAGKLGSPFFSGYNASKFALVGFSESLYIELLGSGVRVTTINPGPVATPFFREGEAERVLGSSGKRFLLPPERVVRAILRAIEKRPREIILPGYMRLVLFFKALFPKTFSYLSARLFPKGAEKEEEFRRIT